MKNLVLLLLIALVGWGFYNQRSAAQPLAMRFRPVDHPIEERPFVCILCSGPESRHALDSLTSQLYHNYRTLSLDENSDLLTQLTTAIQSCADREIILILNGRGWLAHEWVLARLNQFYANPDLWLTYGQNLIPPSYTKSSSKPLPADNVRSLPRFIGPPITCYASLFKQIDRSSLCYEEQFVPAAQEFAYTLPLIELARDHSQFLSEILYISIPDEESELAAYCERYIRTLPAYPPAESL